MNINLDMFLISKIVRGRRLLHELEAETEKKTEQEAANAGETSEKSLCDMTQVFLLSISTEQKDNK